MSTKKFTSCDEANLTCDKAQYKEATLWEKVKLNLHLIWCSACRKYTKNNVKLTKLVCQEPKTLEPSEKEKIQATLDKELAKQEH